MLDLLKEKVISTGMTLMQSPAVSKMMESEKMGTIIEKALSLPIKISTNITSQRERLVALFDLATQEDLDNVKQSLARVEGVLRDIKQESGDLLRKVESEEPKQPPIAE